ncbi:MAG: hypothetical protein DMH00_05045 [Acidobacteria bacterium]|nr:MAG: hypothetical protein DMH00_05045 [Acidobacteriota bacterium]
MGPSPKRHESFLPVLPFLFLASGFGSLVLEVTWARQLSLLTGSGVRASGAVVAVLLAGLGLGAALAGPLADRLQRPLRAYALTEAGISLWAILTLPLFPRLSGLLPVLREGARGSLDLGFGPLLAICVLVLPGALLMGATTPLVVRADCLLRSPDSSPEAAGRSLGRMYGWNTLGGAAGALSAAFLLLPRLGLRSTLLLAAATDLFVAACALSMSPAASSPTPPDPGKPPGTVPVFGWMSGNPRRGILLFALFLTGTLGALFQVAWTRLLVLFFGSSVQALGLTLAACLLGLGLGSAWTTRRLKRGARAASLATKLCAGGAVATFITLPLWGKLPVLMVLAQARVGTSFNGALLLQSVMAGFLMLPPAAALGALLPALTASLGGGVEHSGKVSGGGFALDSTGSLLGGLGAIYFLLPRVGAGTILRACVLAEVFLLASLTLVATLRAERTALRRNLTAAAVLAAGVLLLPSWNPVFLTSGPLLYGPAYLRIGGKSWSGIQEAMQRRGQLLFLDEGADATVTVRLGAGGTRSLQINGKTDASDAGDLPAQLLAGQIPALLHPAPSRALIIGLASGTTVRALADHSVHRLDCVEISSGVAKAAAYFEKANGKILSDPRFHLYLGDGRVFLEESREPYDLIVSQPTNPWIAGVTNLFTSEFFRAARRRLAKGGILLVWVQGYAMAPEDFRSVIGTFQDVFPGGQLWEESAGGGDYFLVGPRDPEPLTVEAVSTRLDSTAVIRSRLQSAGVRDLADFVTRFLAGGQTLTDFSRGAPRITDDNLRLEYSAPQEIWHNRMPEMLEMLEGVRQPPGALFADLESPSHAELRARLAGLQRGRRDRIRVALTLRREDLEALSSPSLVAAVKLIRDGQEEKALSFLGRARDEARRAPVVPLLQGWTLLGQNRSAEAERAFRAARELDSLSADAAEGLGIALYRQGRLGEAARLFVAATALDPGSAGPVSNLGAVRLAQGRTREALGLLDRALERDPTHLSARINRGVALARLGRVQEAVTAYEQALEKDPGNEDALYNLRRARERLSEASGRKP